MSRFESANLICEAAPPKTTLASTAIIPDFSSSHLFPDPSQPPRLTFLLSTIHDQYCTLIGTALLTPTRGGSSKAVAGNFPVEYLTHWLTPANLLIEFCSPS